MFWHRLPVLDAVAVHCVELQFLPEEVVFFSHEKKDISSNR